MNKDVISGKITARTPLTTEEKQFAVAQGLITAEEAVAYPTAQSTEAGKVLTEEVNLGGNNKVIVTQSTEKHLIGNATHGVSWKQHAPRQDGKAYMTAKFTLGNKETFTIIEGNMPENACDFFVDNVRENGEFEGTGTGGVATTINKQDLMRATFQGWKIVNETLTFREQMEIMKECNISPTINMGRK